VEVDALDSLLGSRLAMSLVGVPERTVTYLGASEELALCVESHVSKQFGGKKILNGRMLQQRMKWARRPQVDSKLPIVYACRRHSGGVGLGARLSVTRLGIERKGVQPAFTSSLILGDTKRGSGNGVVELG
jgi:hypothetical protein